MPCILTNRRMTPFFLESDMFTFEDDKMIPHGELLGHATRPLLDFRYACTPTTPRIQCVLHINIISLASISSRATTPHKYALQTTLIQKALRDGWGSCTQRARQRRPAAAVATRAAARRTVRRTAREMALPVLRPARQPDKATCSPFSSDHGISRSSQAG